MNIWIKNCLHFGCLNRLLPIQCILTSANTKGILLYLFIRSVASTILFTFPIFALILRHSWAKNIGLIRFKTFFLCTHCVRKPWVLNPRDFNVSLMLSSVILSKPSVVSQRRFKLAVKCYRVIIKWKYQNSIFINVLLTKVTLQHF